MFIKNRDLANRNILRKYGVADSDIKKIFKKVWDNKLFSKKSVNWSKTPSNYRKKPQLQPMIHIDLNEILVFLTLKDTVYNEYLLTVINSFIKRRDKALKEL